MSEQDDYTVDLLEAFDDVFYVVDTEGYPVHWNSRLAEVTGYSDNEIAGMPATAFFPDEVGEAVEEDIERVFETGKSYVELPVLTRDGERIPFEFIGSRVVNPDGEPHLVGIGRDITERKRRERELKREREQLDALFQNLPNPVLRTSLTEEDARVLDVNPAFERTFGYRAEDIEGELVFDLILPDEKFVEKDPAGLVGHLHREGELHTDLRREAVDGVRDFRVDVTVRTEEDPPEGFAIYTDITEHKQRERRRERRYEAIFNHSYQYTGLLDPTGRVLEVNQAALEVAGFEEREVVGKLCWELPWWRDDEQARRKVREGVEQAVEGEFVRFEMADRGDGHEIVVDFSIRPVTDEDGEVIYLLPEGRNVTELRAMKERERALERQNERLDEFASLVSHDLRNPLNAAVTHLELARAECDSEALDAVSRSHERMRSLIEDVLALARQGRMVTSTQVLNLAEVFERIVYDMGTGKARFVAETDKRVYADKRRLHRLLENLVRNAIEHGGKGVTVRLGGLPGGFYLEDDGPGIREEDYEQVFEPGYSTDESGTGFGLSIVREIAEAHGWRVELVESPEGGARFEMTGVESA